MGTPAVSNRRAPAHSTSIADLARRLGVTPRTLRHYQDQGLIRSHRIARNTRAYDLETVAIVETIVALRETGLSITTIHQILRSEPETQAATLRAALAEVLADMHRQIAKIDDMLETLTGSPPTPLRLPLPVRAPGPSSGRKTSGSGPMRQEAHDDRS